MNFSNPAFSDAFFFFFFLKSAHHWLRLQPSLLSHWTAPQSQTVSPCGVAIEDVRHLNETDTGGTQKSESNF